jgi:hypothetical protein
MRQYKESRPFLYFKFKVPSSENEYFSGLDTMPLLLSITALPSYAASEYVKGRVGSEIWIMVKQRVAPVMLTGHQKLYHYRTVTGKT